jgi:hypothetical protein
VRIGVRLGMIELRRFQYFLSEVATWARNAKVAMNGFQVGFALFPFCFRFIFVGTNVVGFCG